MPSLLRFAPLALVTAVAHAEPVETEIPGVVAEIAELRTSAGVTRLAVRYKNTQATDIETDLFESSRVALVDAKSKQKHSPIKDANGQVIGGPINDEIGGGRFYVRLRAPSTEGILWTYFEPLPAGTKVSVELPQMFPFDDVVVTEGEGLLTSATEARSTPAGVVATLVSAKRADGVVKARVKFAPEGTSEVMLRSSYFEYKGVYLFDTVSKRRYPLMKDSEGKPVASPALTNMPGSFLPDWRKPILMSLTFQAPPDDVTRVDLVLNDFLPMEGVALEGLGGAGAGGIAAAGKALGLEGALAELGAKVEPKEISIDLAADVLFDFDKAELKPAAETSLNNLLTVVGSRPTATVFIEGHTDVRGAEDYNLTLSQRRAESVSGWLEAHGVPSARLRATGAGETRAVASGDTEADHAKNRRVEIRIRG